jgi:acetylornithine deacetylase/succinyl-diaminopimelate desuccinylase
MEPGDINTEDILKDLIAIPSYSGKEKEIQEYIAGFLEALEVNFRRIPVDGQDRYNIVSLNSRYMVSVHVDTVPPIDMGAKATKPVYKDGKIFGRGASDIKGGIAALLSALKLFRERFPAHEVPISLAFVVDEESNSALGSSRLVEHLENIKSVLVLEPTYGKLCTSQAGSLEFSVELECPSVHASEFEKAQNPVKLLIKFINSLEETLRREINVLLLRSGWKYYATPKKAQALLEVKLYKGDDPKGIETLIRKLLAGILTGCRAKYTCEDYEEFIEFRCESLLSKVKQAYRKATKEEALTSTMPSWTDAANYHKAGLECLVFGFGSLKDSHTNRENISIKDLINFRDTLYELMKIILHEKDSERNSKKGRKG